MSMPLVLSDIRRPTFTICACVTSQIAKSFLFDRRSDLLSFRLVARPPPTQDPVNLTISRGFWLLLRSAKYGFHCSTQISSGRSHRQLHCSFCQSTPFSRISALYTYVDSMSRVSSTTTFSSAFYNQASLAASGSLWLCQYA